MGNTCATWLCLVLLLLGMVVVNARGSRMIWNRELVSEDFEKLNMLLGNMELSLPDIAAKTTLLGFEATIHVHDLTCVDLSLDGISMKSMQNAENGDVYINTTISGIAVTCHSPRVLIQSALTSGAFAVTVMSFSSFLDARMNMKQDGDTFLDQCSTILDLKAEFSGTNLQSLLNALQGEILPYVKPEISKALCGELGGLASSVLSGVVKNFTSTLESYGSVSLDVGHAKKNETSSNEWVDMETSSFFGTGFSLAENLLSKKDEDSGELGMTGVLSQFTHGNGSYQLDFTSTPMELFSTSETDLLQAKASLSRVEISGLDTLSKVRLAKPVAPYELESELEFQQFYVSIDLILVLGLSSDNSQVIHAKSDQVVEISEKFRIGFALSGLDVLLDLLIGLNSVRGRALKVGPLIDHPMECALSTIDVAELDRMILRVDDFASPDLSGFLSEGISALVEDIVSSALLLLKPKMLQALPGFTQSVGRDIMNEQIDAFLSDPGNSLCPEPSKYEDEPWFDFATDPLFQKLVDLIRTNVVPNVNEQFIAPATRKQSGVAGTYIIQEDRSLVHVNLDPLGTLWLGVEKAKLIGLDTMYNITFMDTPYGPGYEEYPYILRNAAHLGLASKQQVTGFETVLEIEMAGDQINFRDLFLFRFRFDGLEVLMEVLARISRFRFASLNLEQALDPYCLLSRLDEAAFKNLSMAFKHVDIDLECIDCNSPGIIEMEQRVKSESANEQFTSTMNTWIKIILRRIMEKLDPESVQHTLELAHQECLGQGMVNFGDTDLHIGEEEVGVNVLGVIGGLAGSMACASILNCCLNLRKPNIPKLRGKKEERDCETIAGPRDDASSSIESWSGRWFRLGSVSSNEGDAPIEDVITPDIDFRRDDDTNEVHDNTSMEQRQAGNREHSQSLLFHPYISAKVRYGILFLLFVNIGLFIAGHTIIAASVSVEIVLIGNEMEISGFADFSLGSSLKDMWHAGVYSLAILIGSLSGAWPYIKVLTLIYCWTTPPKRLNPEKRGRILSRLDALGKWSLIDVFVMVLCMVAFRLHVENPNLEILPDGFYTADVRVDPAMGLYSFSMAAILALLTNNICIIYHLNAISADESVRRNRQIELKMRDMNGDTNEDEECLRDYLEFTRQRGVSSWMDAGTEDVFMTREKQRSMEKRALAMQVFEIGSKEERAKLHITWLGRNLVKVLIFTALVLEIWGASATLFQFHVLGIVGMAMDIEGDDRSHIPMSMFQLFWSVMEQAPSDDTKAEIGYAYLALSSLFAAFVMPVMQLIALWVLWNVPMTLRNQKKAFLANEIISAWAASEVFIVAILVAVLELPQLSEFLLGGVCKHLLPTITGILVPIGLIQDENGTCFYVSSSLQIGAVLLLAAGFVSNIVSFSVLRIGETALEQREHYVKGEDDNTYVDYLADRIVSSEMKNESDHHKRMWTVWIRAFAKCGIVHIEKDSSRIDEDEQIAIVDSFSPDGASNITSTDAAQSLMIDHS